MHERIQAVSRRGTIGQMAAAVLAAGLGIAPPAWGQAPAYPTKPVHIIVTFTPGGAPDILGRILADKLGQALIAPLGLAKGQRLIIVPHGPLHYLPFQALRLDGKYLIQRNPMSIAPSISVAARLGVSRPPGSLMYSASISGLAAIVRAAAA